MRTKLMDTDYPYKYFYDDDCAVLDLVEFICMGH